MTTLSNRPNAAVLVIDVQVGVVGSAHARDVVIGKIANVVDKARAEGVAVIWVQHQSEELTPDTDSWRIVPELKPREGEAVIHKRYGDAFEETDLEAVLERLGVGRLFVTGAQSDACIRCTIHGGLTRGYDVTLVSDAHTTEDLSAYGAPPPAQVIAHTNLYWKYQTAPGRTAGVADASALDFAPASAA